MEDIVTATSGKFIPRQNFLITSLAENLLKREILVGLEKEEGGTIDTIVLSPFDLGFKERMPKTDELFDPAYLTRWSKSNRERLNGSVVTLLPCKAILCACEKCADQLGNRALWMAMKSTAGNGSFYIFVIRKNADSTKCLTVVCVRSSGRWDYGIQFLFRLQKLNLSS